MNHSVKQLAKQNYMLSLMRGKEPYFNELEFLEFAKENKVKYNLIEDGDDFWVSTWNCDGLIYDFQKIKGIKVKKKLKDRIIKFILNLVVFSFGIAFKVILDKSKVHNENKKLLRDKLKYFIPFINKGIFRSRVSWQMREKPLTDEELDVYMKDYELIKKLTE